MVERRRPQAAKSGCRGGGRSSPPPTPDGSARLTRVSPGAGRRGSPPPPQTGMPPDEPAYEGRGERLQPPEQDRQRREDERGAPRPLCPIDLLGHVARGPRPRALR